MSTIRVALAEDNVLLREGVSRLVSAHPDLELVGTASDLATAVLDLPTVPGTDAVIAAAQGLNAATQAVGLDRPHALLREQERALEALRF